MEKRIASLIITFILLFAILPYSAAAQVEDGSIKNTSSGNAFGAGNNIRIDQDVQGDLVLAGSSLEINGKVMDDFIGAGGEVIVNGNVSGNVIVAGGSVKVNGDVGGDVAAFGGQIFLSKDSVVQGDVLLGGGEVTLNGIVNGNGDISATTLRTGNDFKLKGNLQLQAENYPSNLKDNVGGSLNVTQTNQTANQYEGIARGFGVVGFIVGLLAAIALGLVLIYLFPWFVSELSGFVRESPLKSILIGFLAVIFVPIFAIVLLITFFGWSLSALIILVLLLAMLIATVPVKLLAGEMIYNRLFKKEAGKMVYYLIGAIIFAIAYEIPLVGGLIQFVALLLGLGAVILWLASERSHPAS
jgi:hypothetical protein